MLTGFPTVTVGSVNVSDAEAALIEREKPIDNTHTKIAVIIKQIILFFISYLLSFKDLGSENVVTYLQQVAHRDIAVVVYIAREYLKLG